MSADQRAAPSVRGPGCSIALGVAVVALVDVSAVALGRAGLRRRLTQRGTSAAEHRPESAAIRASLRCATRGAEAAAAGAETRPARNPFRFYVSRRRRSRRRTRPAPDADRRRRCEPPQPAAAAAADPAEVHRHGRRPAGARSRRFSRRPRTLFYGQRRGDNLRPVPDRAGSAWSRS